MFEKTTKENIVIEKNNNNINTKIRSYINRLTFFYNYVEAAALYSSKWLQKCKQLAISNNYWTSRLIENIPDWKKCLHAHLSD